MATTPSLANVSRTAGTLRAVRSLNLHEMHQSAVKSTKTASPDLSSSSSLLVEKGCQSIPPPEFLAICGVEDPAKIPGRKVRPPKSTSRAIPASDTSRARWEESGPQKAP